MHSKGTRAEFTILAGGVAVVIGSFAPFYSFSGIGTVKAWDTGLSPLALYPVFAGVISAGVIALRRFANAQLAVRLGSFTWEQIHLLLGLFAFLVSVGYYFGTHTGSFGWGFWIMFGGSIALLVGGVMLSRERSGPRGLV
ncbi:MAG: hypothetical protein ACXVJ7_17655 [Acidimicrobiia bacterium]